MHRLPYHQRNKIIKMNHTNIIMKYLISYMMWTLVFYLIGYYSLLYFLVFFNYKKIPILGGALTCFLISECCTAISYWGIFPVFLSNMRLDWGHICH